MKKLNNLFKAAEVLAVAVVAFVLMPVMAFADGKATVTASSAYIRSSASTSGGVVGSVMKNDTLDVISSETDAAGNVWYKVFVDANTTGYIRSDLVTTEGVKQTTSTTTTTTTGNNTTVTVDTKPADVPVTVPTETEPVSASVTGEVRVRQGASTSTTVVETAKAGTNVTVIGYAKSTDGNTWYQVNYTANNKEVSGYIRSDFVKLGGELLDKQPEPEPEPEPEATEPEPEPEPEPVYKDYECVFDESEQAWYLNNYIEGTRIKLDDLYKAKDLYSDATKQVESLKKSKKAIVISFVVVVLAFIGAGVFAFLRFRKWYFGYDEEPEEPVRKTVPKETARAYEEKPSQPVRRTNVSAQTVGGSHTTEVKPTHTSPSVTGIPEGGVRLPDGRIQMPDGSIRRAVVGVKLPDGSIKLPDGRIRKPDGTMVTPNVVASNPLESRTAASSQEVRSVSYRTTSQVKNDDDDMEFGFLNLDSDID